MLRQARRGIRSADRRRSSSAPSRFESAIAAAGSTVLLDYNPAVSIGSAGFVYQGTGAITAGNRRGIPCAECDGQSALTGPALFENLSDLSGGVSVYLVIEQDIKYAASGAASAFSMRRQAAATQRDCLGVYQVHVGTAFVGLVGDDAAASTPISYMSKKGVVFHSMHATTAEVRVRNLHSGGNISAAPTAPHDPSGMDQTVIGASAVFGTVNGWLTGAIYRILVCEGPYDAAVDAEIQSVYTPIPGLMYDFDPIKSLTEDQFDGLAISDPIGGVALGLSATGTRGAAFDGTNYLTSLPPFATLAELNSGLTVYTVFEHTAAGATGGYGGLWSVDRTAGLTFADRLSASRYDPNEQVYNYAHNAAVTQVYHTFASKVPLGVVCFHAAQYSLTVRYAGLGGALTNSADFTSISPVGMDRLVIGGATYGTTVGYLVEGVTMRVLFCEGPYKQTVMDALIDRYAPRRLPPTVDPSTVAFLFDPRQGMYRDTLTGISLTPTSAPYRVARGGDVAAFFDGSDDRLNAALATAIGDMDGSHTVYVVQENSTAGLSYPMGLYQLADSANESFLILSRVAAGLGATAYQKEGGAQTQDGNGGIATQGKVQVLTAAKTPTTLEAFLDGVSNGASADTAVPRGIDYIAIGSGGAAGLANGYIYFILIVNEARSAAVETWINANFPVGTSP